MKNYFYLLLQFVLMTLFIGACLPSKTIGTQGEETYSEDISKLRENYTDSLKNMEIKPAVSTNRRPGPETPNLTVNPDSELGINQRLDNFLDEATDLNAENNQYQGYTVQVYTGSSRENASEAKNKVYSILPESSPTISFDPPNYKVKVGEYVDRLEAQPTYQALKNAFPVVLIVPERFPVVRND